MNKASITLLLLFISFPLFAQDDTIQKPDTLITNPERTVTDSLGLGLKDLPSQRDSIPNIADSLKVENQLTKQPVGDIKTTVNYDARDSIFFDVKKQNVYLYGDTHIDYGEVQLEAEKTELNWINRTIKAYYVVDSTGKKIGKPVFTEQNEVYETDNMVYNFDTKKAVISGIVTEQDGAFMHGERVKKNEKDELFIRGASYTTCNLAEPHFHIYSEKLKAIPGNKVMSGPFNLKFKDVPTPLFFPFGMFPQPNKKASGIIFPTYGEERRRGFFLRDGGYYWMVNDYVDMLLTGSIFSNGGSALRYHTNYKKRYRYNGSFDFNFTSNRSAELEDPIKTNDFSVRWSHRPDNRGRSSNFSASVNARTSTFNQNNNETVRDFESSIQGQFGSNITYSNALPGTPFNLSANLRHSQNLQTKVVNLTLPEITVNMNRIYPLEKLVGRKNPLAKFNFNYNTRLTNRISNQPLSVPSYVINSSPLNDSILAFDFNNFGRIFDRAKNGITHDIQAGTSFNILKYLTVSPSFSYSELWYFKQLRYEFDAEQNGVRVDTLDGFARAGSYRTSFGLNTTIYGFYPFPKKSSIQAIRHIIRPSVSFSFNPDFSNEKFGVFREVQIDTAGTTRRLSKFENFIFGSGPTGGQNASASFSINNTFEMKVKSKNDSTDETKKVKLLDNLSLSTSYNFAADSFQLSNINFNTRTSLFKNALSIAVSGTVDPYLFVVDSSRSTNQRQINEFAWNRGQGLGTLSALRTSIGLRLAPKGRRKKKESDKGTEEELEYINRNISDYIDFTVPWNLNIQYSINRTKNGMMDPNITQTLTFTGDVSITDKTKITYRSGFDFEDKQFTTARIGVSRDLHCWTLLFNWVPFGAQASYNFTIRVKSPILQDLKLEKRRNFFDNF